MAKRKGIIKSTATREAEEDKQGFTIEGKGLRLAWIKFIDAYIQNGGNATEAYMVAYPESSKQAARFNASRLITNDNVAEEINNRLTTQRVTDEFIYSGFVYLYLKHKDGKGAIVAEKAMESLSKMRGLMVDTKKVAFTGENPAVFLPVYTAKEKEEFEKIREKKQRITE
jgi:phage terminase small subunit